MENNFNCHPEKWLWLLTRDGYLQEVEATGQNLTEHFGVLDLWCLIWEVIGYQIRGGCTQRFGSICSPAVFNFVLLPFFVLESCVWCGWWRF